MNGGDLISYDETSREPSWSAVHPLPNQILISDAHAPDLPAVFKFPHRSPTSPPRNEPRRSGALDLGVETA